MIKIIQYGGGLTNNLGGPSLYFSIAAQLRKEFGNEVEIVFVPQGFEANKEQLKEYKSIEAINTIQPFRARIRYSGFFISVLAKKLPLPMFKNMIKKNKFTAFLNSADIVMDIRGITQTDFFGSTLEGYLRDNLMLLTAHYLGKTTVKYTQDMGPFESFKNKLFSKFMLKKLDLVMARGIITRQLLKNIGITKNVVMKPDSAFILGCADGNELDEIMKKEGIANSKYITVVASKQVDRRSLGKGSKEMQSEYTINLAAAIDRFIDKYKINFLLLPNEYGLSENDHDDIYTAKKVYALIKNKEHVKIITNKYNAFILKGIINKGIMSIVSRYHSVVASLSLMKPTLVIGWGYKYDQILELTGQMKYIHNYTNFTEEKCFNSMEELYNEKEKVVEHLKLVIPGIKEEILKNGEIIAKLLREKN